MATHCNDGRVYAGPRLGLESSGAYEPSQAQGDGSTKVVDFGLGNFRQSESSDCLNGRLCVAVSQRRISHRFKFVRFVPRGIMGRPPNCDKAPRFALTAGVLEPLLFHLYINDIANVVPHLNVNLFADVTKLFIDIKNTLLLKCTANEAINNLNNWFIANKHT